MGSVWKWLCIRMFLNEPSDGRLCQKRERSGFQYRYRHRREANTHFGCHILPRNHFAEIEQEF
ncbi:Uncharacterised protein [Klebsiella pneumoniae]|nr:Uncharacterised protein [Klebsiella pneumoniae]